MPVEFGNSVTDMTLLTLSDFQQVLQYNPATGYFLWKIRMGRNVMPGQCAGCVVPTGYVQIRLYRKNYKAHRLAWLFCYGDWPSDQIDHFNGRKSDNRILNLRDVGQTTNKSNQKKAQRNNHSTGVLNVFKNGNGFMARVRCEWGSNYLGTFATIESAIMARDEFKRSVNHPSLSILNI